MCEMHITLNGLGTIEGYIRKIQHIESVCTNFDTTGFKMLENLCSRCHSPFACFLYQIIVFHEPMLTLENILSSRHHFTTVGTV